MDSPDRSHDTLHHCIAAAFPVGRCSCHIPREFKRGEKNGSTRTSARSLTVPSRHRDQPRHPPSPHRIECIPLSPSLFIIYFSNIPFFIGSSPRGRLLERRYSCRLPSGFPWSASVHPAATTARRHASSLPTCTSTFDTYIMSIFNQKSKFKVKTEIRTVRQAVAPKPKPQPQPSAVASSSAAGANSRKKGFLSAASSRASPKSTSPHPSPRPTEASNSSGARKRRAGSSRSPASPSFSDSEDEDEDWEDSLDARKRMKRAHEAQQPSDPNRVVRHPKLWTGAGGDEADVARLPIIHASRFASLEQKCQPVLGLAPDDVRIKLQYPGARHPERYVT
jgi:hypothetical protein